MWSNCFYNPRRELDTRAPVVGGAPIVVAARSAGHGCGCVPEENHFMYHITDGSQAVTPQLEQAYYSTVPNMGQNYYTEADGNQRADSGMEQLNFRSDGMTRFLPSFP